MTYPDQKKMDRMLKNSQFAAWGTLSGALIVFAAIGFSFFRLNDAENQLANLEKKSGAQKSAIETQLGQIGRLKGEIKGAEETLEQKKQALEKVQKDLETKLKELQEKTNELDLKEKEYQHKTKQ